YIFFFFFSSRRRHTRWPRDWSSDVCSSDLALPVLTAVIMVTLNSHLPSIRTIVPLLRRSSLWYQPVLSDRHGQRLVLHFAHVDGDRKSTRLNSSHVAISYAVFCLKKKI